MENTLPKIKVDPEGPTSGTVAVTAVLNDGTEIKDECVSFKGSAKNPMNASERLDKVVDCISRAISDSETKQVIELAHNLEDVDDISNLMSLLGKASSVRS